MDFNNHHLREITLTDVMIIPSSGEYDPGHPGQISFCFIFNSVKYCKQLANGSRLRNFENKRAIAYFSDRTNAQSLAAFICLESEIVVGVGGTFELFVLLPLLFATGMPPLFIGGLLAYLSAAISIGASIYLLPKSFRNFKIRRTLKQAVKEKNEKNRP
jgi:hypothetical protein